jgi:hypothetical protein
MNNTNLFKKATKEAWKFATPKGQLTVIGLWALTLEQLDKVAVQLFDEAQSKKVSFLKKTTTEGKHSQEKLDLVLEIIDTKQDEIAKQMRAKEIKEEKQRLLALLEKKEQEELEGLSKEEILKMLNSIDE